MKGRNYYVSGYIMLMHIKWYSKIYMGDIQTGLFKKYWNNQNLALCVCPSIAPFKGNLLSLANDHERG